MQREYEGRHGFQQYVHSSTGDMSFGMQVRNSIAFLVIRMVKHLI